MVAVKPLALLGLSCALLLPAGCDPVAGSGTSNAPPTPPSSQLSNLETENEELRQRLREQEEFLRTYSSMTNAVLRNLRTITGEEDRVLQITRAMGRETVGYRKREYRQELGDLLASIDEKLREGERAKSELQMLIARGGEEAAELRLAVSELGKALEQQQARIRGLRAEVESLHLENQTLEREVVSERERRRHEEERVQRLQAITHAYLLVAEKSQFKRLRREGLLRRNSGDLEPTPEALGRHSYETVFMRVDGTLTEIPLGRGRRKVRVRSVHRSYPNLYRIEQRAKEHVLVVRHPAAFWRISRFLVVQVK